MERHLTEKATDPDEGMTLAELAACVEEARRQGIPDGAHPKVVVKAGFRTGGRIKKFEIQG